MTKKIYIGNLIYTLETNDLEDLFGEFGSITDAVVIRDKESGASRGFGFVTFTSEQSAKSAVSTMHGKKIEGRMLRVKFAEAKVRDPYEAVA